MFFTPFDCLSRKGTLFKKKIKRVKKSVPFRGKCMCFTPFDCSSRKGTLFFNIFQI